MDLWVGSNNMQTDQQKSVLLGARKRQEFAIKRGGQQPSMPLQGEKPPHFGRSLLMRPAPCPACWWPSLPGILSSNMRFMRTHAPLLCTNALPSSWFCLQSTNSFCSAHAQAYLGTHGACIFCNSHTLHVQQSIFAQINILEVP